VTDPFETLGLDPTFDLDLTALERRQRDLSRALHPDRYVGRPPAERRQALGRAIEVNDAARKLKDPIARAEVLLGRAGVAVGETAEPKADPELLMDMMEQREALADARRARDLAAVTKLARAVAERQRAALDRLRADFARATGPGAANPGAANPGAANPGAANPAVSAALLRRVGELCYYRRFLDEVAAIEDELA
jgi:molecular chaperone HscB